MHTSPVLNLALSATSFAKKAKARLFFIGLKKENLGLEKGL